MADLILVIRWATPVKNKLRSPHDRKRPFSIIIPFRNEERHLEKLIDSLKRAWNGQPEGEVILVNDHSTDRSVEKLRAMDCPFPCQVIQAEDYGFSPKKNALATGIDAARYDWIITMDADTFVEPSYFEALAEYLPGTWPFKMSIAPVDITVAGTGIAQTFQRYENLYLQGLTRLSARKGHPLLSNGAHLMFDRQAYRQTGGYAGLPPTAGGDDMFLMLRFKKSFPGLIDYWDDPKGRVFTYTVRDFRSLIEQRLRWAKKTFRLDDRDIRLYGILQFVYAFGFIACMPCGKLWFTGQLLRLTTEMLVTRPLAQWWNHRFRWTGLLLWHFLAPPVYWITALESLLPVEFEWKSRRYRH